MDVKRKGRYNRNAYASCLLALAAVLTSGWWLVGTVLACAAIAFALVSRKALKEDDDLRGAGLSLAGFLVSVAVLVFVTVGPSLLSLCSSSLSPRRHRSSRRVWRCTSGEDNRTARAGWVELCPVRRDDNPARIDSRASAPVRRCASMRAPASSMKSGGASLPRG